MSFGLKPLGWTALAAVLLGAWAISAQSSGDLLERGFENPPDSAKPRVWWHWMNGNITKEGIKLDLEWMKRIGIGGFQNFDAALSTPQVVDRRLAYMTPEWKEAFQYAATLADQLGLEMAIAASPGWSETGGPWVLPAQAMKKLVWSETRVEGGQPVTGTLPKPPSTTGPFQNLPRGGQPSPPVEFYADAAVVAWRAPQGDTAAADLPAKVTSSGGRFDLSALTDGNLTNFVPLPAPQPGAKAWLQFEFAQPTTVHAVTVFARNTAPPPTVAGPRELTVSEDGSQFRTVATLPADAACQHTTAFQPATARFFRVTFGTSQDIAELALHTSARVHRFEEKAAFLSALDLYAWATPPAPAEATVRKQDVVDLTARMRPDGSLDWTPPPGRWVVQRLGYSLTGARNSPASAEATGFEVDKLDRDAVKTYLEHYLGLYQETLGPLMGKRGLRHMVIDSWEAGVQNWTPNMLAEFTKRRGYDARPWLPVLTGRVVESSESSDRFLWDFRQTISDLTAANHYDQIGDLLHQRGMSRYTESHESGRAFIGDGMEAKRAADVPMSAMWTQNPGEDREQFRYNTDIRESASVAHIYGQNLVAAESLTAGGSAWAYSPETLKPTADKEMALGLNRFVIHTSVHQPLPDRAPGLTLGRYGQWFTRHETWAEAAKPWISYLARSSYLLQQGQFAADILYFYGEGSNLTALFGNRAPDVPAGYAFDYINADALTHRVSVVNGRLATPSGMQYRLLVLDPYSQQMTLPVLRKLRDLVRAGAIICGPRPAGSPSLSDNPTEFRAIADQLWGSTTGQGHFGAGNVFAGQSLAATLAALKVAPDFEYVRPQVDTNLLYVHRRLATGDVYWVNHRNPRAETVEVSFRTQGRAAELWHPDTGKREAAPYRIAGGRTVVPLRLDPYDAVFVVFRKAAAAPARPVRAEAETPLATLEGPWEVRFQPERGAPATVTLDSLSSWSLHPDTGIKYFSGSATYAKTLEAPATWQQPGARLWLDLGGVKNLADVSLNGKPLGSLWKAPFRIDLTGVLKPGANALEVKVTNLWVNRLIGDQQPGISQKFTFTPQPPYRADSPLLPSGLLGPVRIVRVGR